MSDHLTRAQLLLAQSRYEAAERELGQALVADPHNAYAHSLMALCLAEREKFAEATRAAQQAIHESPDLDFAHYALGQVYYRRNRYQEAAAAVSEAIRLDPYDADYWSLAAAIQFGLRKWDKALAAAEAGLEVNAEHVQCANIRSSALVNLGRRAEAGQALDAVLSKNPENAVTHANRGWALLHSGEPKKALEHFRESLRLDPTLDFARAGIVEAMKARNIIYRVMLGYFLWMSRLSGRAQWIIVIGAYLLQQFLSQIARQNPKLAPYLDPILYLYLAFVLLTWLSVPLFNMMLRFSRFGRMALSRDQIIASNWIAACLGGGIALVIAAFIRDSGPLLIAGIVTGTIAIPLAGVFYCQSGWPRRGMAIYTLALAALGYGWVYLEVTVQEDRAMGLARLYGIGLLIGSFVAAGLSAVRPKK